MEFSKSFYSAGAEYTTYQKHVPAPLMRRVFELEKAPENATLTVCGLGFYRVWVNGKEFTKGELAPYITNPNEMLCYDLIDLGGALREGRNCLAFILGNGMLNAPGGSVWDFETEPWRSAPKLAFRLEADDLVLEADEKLLCRPSALVFDDLRCGVHYDARRALPGWQETDLDDSGWTPAVRAMTPAGKPVLFRADPVRDIREIKPVRVTYGKLAPFRSNDGTIRKMAREGDALYGGEDAPTNFTEGYIYDFGKNVSGVCRLKIKGRPGQKIELQYAEIADTEEHSLRPPITEVAERINYANINFYPDGYSQRDVYVCSGEGEEEFTPFFTYHGFRYCMVHGITEEQAAESLLTCVVRNSVFDMTGGFRCSDEDVNGVFDLCVASDLSNFVYFPTDCPHREKNGWAGDIACSVSHMALLYDCGRSLKAWLDQVRLAQAHDGTIPCMIPTGSWGRHSGPTWDAALTYVPYYLYRRRGDLDALRENAQAIFFYIDGMAAKRDERGLVKEYLGDWLPIGGKELPTRTFTDTCSFYCIVCRAGEIFRVLGMEGREAYAEKLAGELRESLRKAFIDSETACADTRCQTSQALALYLGLFEPEEEERAVELLAELVHERGDSLYVGMLGLRVIFPALSRHGHADLAFRLAFREEYPSYTHFLRQGLTTLPEDFVREDETWDSANHHFFGDIAGWLMTDVAGLSYETAPDASGRLDVVPAFVGGLTWAEAHQMTPFGECRVRWDLLPDGADAAGASAVYESGGRRYAVKVTAPGEIKVTFRENGAKLLR